MRSDRLAVLPALYNIEELETILDWADVVVLMKISSVYPQVWKLLQQRQLLENVVVVERATLPEQVIYADLRDRPNLKITLFFSTNCKSHSIYLVKLVKINYSLPSTSITCSPSFLPLCPLCLCG